MSVATCVTIIVINMPSGSSPKERSILSTPLCHIVQRWSSKNRSCSGVAIIFQNATSATTQDSTIAPIATKWTARFPYVFCRRGPNAVLMADPSSGKKGMSHSQDTCAAWAISVPWRSATAAAASPACSAWARIAARSGRVVMRSFAEEVRLLRVDGAEGLVDGEEDGEPGGRLCRRQHDHEDGEDLPGEPPRSFDEMVEGDEVHVGGIQDELDAHEDADRVPAGDDRDHPEGEERRADDEEVGQADAAHRTVSLVSLISLRAITTAPTSAARRTTEANSNGKRYSVRKATPRPAELGSYEGDSTIFEGAMKAM